MKDSGICNRTGRRAALFVGLAALLFLIINVAVRVCQNTGRVGKVLENVLKRVQKIHPT